MSSSGGWGSPRYPRSPSAGVANIDASKRVDVVSALERAIDELIRLELEIASALLAPTDKTEYAFGHICGSFQATRRCRSILEHCLNAGDPESAERLGDS